MAPIRTNSKVTNVATVVFIFFFFRFQNCRELGRDEEENKKDDLNTINLEKSIDCLHWHEKEGRDRKEKQEEEYGTCEMKRKRTS